MNQIEELLVDFYQRLRVALAKMEGRDAEIARAYYSVILDLPEAAQDWALRSEARRLEPAVEAIGPGVNVLDAGCGFGFHASIFASLGANVIGVDLDAERIAAGEKLTRMLVPDPPRLMARSIHNVLADSAESRLVWVNEAISHIEPVPPFLEAIASKLEPQGRLVVNDHNAANPLIRRHLRRKREFEILSLKPDPEGGDEVPYADERAYTPGQIERLFKDAGLHVTRFIPHGFVPIGMRRGPAAPLLRRIENGIRVLPGAKWLAGSFTVVGMKQPLR